MSIFTGAGTALVTPMNADGSVNFAKMKELIEFQIENSIDALIICGTTGEASTMSDEVQVECVRFAKEVAAGRCPIIAGAGSNDTTHCIELAQACEKAGADGVLLAPQNRLCVPGIVAKSSAGCSELLDIRVCDIEDAVKQFKHAGYKVVCAGIRDSVSIYQADLKKPLLLIVGGEKRGISRAVLDAADQVVRIDYGRTFNGSLSAASAATVIAFEV